MTPDPSLEQTSNGWRSFAILLIAHVVILIFAVIAGKHVQLTSRLLFLAMAALWLGLLISGLNKLQPPWDIWVNVFGWIWVFAATALILVGMLLTPLWETKAQIELGDRRIASYVGCDGATTDPCIIVQQEWSLLPGIALKRVLYVRKGRKFAVERVDDQHVRVRAAEFVGEVKKSAEEKVLVTTRWPWESRSDK